MREEDESEIAMTTLVSEAKSVDAEWTDDHVWLE
jgi:superfamily II helicase